MLFSDGVICFGLASKGAGAADRLPDLMHNGQGALLT